MLTVVGGAPKTNPLGPWGTPGPGNFLPQAGGGGVDADDSRVGNAVFRNDRVWYAQTINLPPSSGVGFGLHTAVQWVELDTTGAFVQGGRIEDTHATPWNGGHSYAFASIAVNARDDALVGFSEFQSNDYVDAAYAFRAGTDAPNTLARAGDAQRRRGAVQRRPAAASIAGATTAAHRLTRRTISLCGRCRSTRESQRVGETAPAAGELGGAGSAAARRCRNRSAGCRRSSATRSRRRGSESRQRIAASGRCGGCNPRRSAAAGSSAKARAQARYAEATQESAWWSAASRA